MSGSRVGIITFLHNDNYGSSLQAYALQRVIREMGCECEHIDYRPDSREKIRNLLESGNSPKLVLEGIRKRKVRSEQDGAKRKNAAIPAFYEKYMRLSKVCHNRRELKENARNYDILICGSDQIWNPTWQNSAYFLPFAADNQKKIAYAASFGVSVVQTERKARRIRSWLADFHRISVREIQGADMAEKITGKRPDVMPDPVCLLSRDAWEELAPCRRTEEPCLLCYFIAENPSYWERAEKLAKEKSLKMLVIPVTAESFSRGDERLEGVGPLEFLSALRGAAMVCTDSFHCLAFSTILDRPCEVCRRDRDGDPESKNSRIDSFRRLTAEEGIPALRERGLAWLRDALM